MKFLLGVFIGATAGTLVLVGTVAGFFSGLMLGWQLFASDDDEPTTPEKAPVDSPDEVPYRGMGGPRSAPPQEEVSAA